MVYCNRKLRAVPNPAKKQLLHACMKVMTFLPDLIGRQPETEKKRSELEVHGEKSIVLI